MGGDDRAEGGGSQQGGEPTCPQLLAGRTGEQSPTGWDGADPHHAQTPPPQGTVVTWGRRALTNCKNILNKSALGIRILKPLLSYCGLVAMEKLSPGRHSNQTPWETGNEPQMGWVRVGIKEGFSAQNQEWGRPEPGQYPTTQPCFLKIT